MKITIYFILETPNRWDGENVIKILDNIDIPENTVIDKKGFVGYLMPCLPPEKQQKMVNRHWNAKTLPGILQ